jgi:N6-L-threonylcarbamoyladenine synthase
MKILGIESSCDETSIAILEHKKIIANFIYSQVEHTAYGGVVPEIASRAHLEKIDNLTLSVLSHTGLTMPQIDLIAVTDSPGLAGALLVGVSFALGLHTSWGTPITGVNHLEGHIFSVLLENPGLQLPFLALVVSGGHTAIYKVENIGTYTCIGQTVDDAAGEAFDKVGKMLHFNYPAGKSIEEEASKATDTKIFQFPVARCASNAFDFSFSGLKTAVKYFLSDKTSEYIADNRPMICKAFQNAVVESLVNNLLAASKKTGIKEIALVGGVACNGKLRAELKAIFGESAFFPSPKLCTDNAAMIALAGQLRFEHNLSRLPHMNPASGL